MKIKNFIKFICLFAVIISAYLLFITHIDAFIIDYDGKLYTSKNVYDSSYPTEGKIGTILTTADYEIASIETLKNFLETTNLATIVSNLFNTAPEDAKAILYENCKMKNMNILHDEYYDGDIYYLNVTTTVDEGEEKYMTLMFTDDLEQIYYFKYLSNLDCESPINSNTGSDIIDLELVRKNIKNHFREMGLIEKYALESSSIKSAWLREYQSYDGNYLYYIDDYIDNIKIEYNLLCDEIYSLQIGFN